MTVIKQGLANLKSKIKEEENIGAILSNISWLFFDKVLRIGLGFVITAWTARFLGTELFGLWNYAIAFTALFSVFSTLGLDSIVVKELVKEEKRRNEILGAAFFLKLIGGGIALLLSVASIYMIRAGDELVHVLVAIIASGFIFQSFDVIDYFYQSKLKSKLTVVARNCAFLISASIKIALLLSEASLVNFVVASLIEVAFASVFLLLLYSRKSGSVTAWTIRSGVVWKLTKESFPLLFANMVILIYMRTDQIMLGNMIGDSEVGVFSAAVRLSEAWYFIPLIITNSLLPSIIAAKDSDSAGYVSKVQRSFDIMAILGTSTAVTITVLAYLIIQLVFGSEYQRAAPILTIHTWTSVFVFIGFASGNWFVVENLQKFVFYRTLAGAVINVGLNLLLIPHYGGTGAAVATLVSQFVASYFFNLFNSRTYPVFRMQSIALLKVTGVFFLYQYMKKAS